MNQQTDTQIEKFTEMVLWVEEFYGYHECSLPRRFNCYKIKTDTGSVKNAITCSSQELWEIDSIYKELNCGEQKTWVIIDGAVSKSDIERFFWTSSRSLIPVFLDCNSQFQYDQLILSVLSGVDWGRSLTSGNLTFEWEQG